MTPGVAESLRRAAAHVVVDDVDAPVLDDAAAHHLFRVVRIADGQVVSVTDGRGGWRLCRAVGGALEVFSDVAVESPPTSPLTIGVAIPKGDRPEWIVQKLTELGVDRIVLLDTERSVVHWDHSKSTKQLSRLRRIAIEAVQQSRRVRVPLVEGVVPAASFLPGAVAAEPGAAPDDGRARTVAIGPEGGWTDRELGLAGGLVSLGPSVLRVETAALVVAARRLDHAA